MKRITHRRAEAQALVEFALAATLLFFLLAAVVDLGLIFFTQQALRVAAQEGATYGSYPKAMMEGDEMKYVYLDSPEIVNRVYGAGGDQGGGFANLRDLNANGLDDLTVDGLHGGVDSDPEAYIYVENLRGLDPTSLNSDGCRGDVRGSGLQRGGEACWIRVTVRYNYRFLFPFAPAFADTVRLQASHLMPIRSSFYTGP